MSKTIRHNAESYERAGREDLPDKEDVPAPYPPVQPTVAQRKSEKKNR